MFKRFKKNKGSDMPVFVLSCAEDAITINGTEISFPAHLNDLIAILGEPSRKEHDLIWRVLWDDIGVYCHYGAWDKIFSLQFLNAQEDRVNWLPTSFFKGQILIEGTPYGGDIFEQIPLGRHAVRLNRYKGEGAPFAFSVGKNYDFKDELLADKYVLKTSDEETLEFKDFNFKLAVIEELMYSADHLKPRFDLREFVECHKAREIDLEEEGYDFIPEVTAYFKALPIPTRLAKHVKKIYQDGGNDIYMQMINFWDGESDIFNIQSADDAAHFPKLKKITLFWDDGETMKQAFEARGIKAEYL